MGEVDPDGDVAGLDACVTGFDALTGLAALTDFDAFTDLEALTDFDAFTSPDHSVVDPDHQRDLKHIVDSLLIPLASASLGRFLSSRLMRQV